jgi:hypothetical protein
MLGTQFTCFTGTKVEILLLVGMWAQPPMYVRFTQFTCFTGTKVEILTQLWQKKCSQPSPATNTA